MIDKKKLTEVVEDAIKDTDIFLVDIKVSSDNNIAVEIDSKSGLDIATCADLTRKIEEAFDRDVEDYELEVGSAGLTSPFKVKQQYEKNIGNDVDVVTRDGRKLSGRLTAVTDTDFTIEVPTKVKEEGQKRPVVKDIPETIAMDNAKSVVYAIKFK
ncbi:MAG: ribosome assembly cofactor RimP [Muribaculaceae bacterium]|nr:ribosome assembly cofactor RimP [Muribaculaceae bacterium]